MATGRHARNDGNKSPNYCLGIIIVVFVLTCLVGAWMTLSSSIGPVRMGISVDQFMGGMPQKGSGSNPSNIQENKDPVLESRGSDSDETRKDESKEKKDGEAEKDKNSQKASEESISISVQNNTGFQLINDGENGLDASNQKATRGKSEDVTLQNNDGDGETGSKESPEEMKQLGETESKKSSQEQVKVSNENFNVKTPESGSKDGIEMLNETSTQVVPWPTQFGESEKEKNLERSSSSKHQNVYRWKVCNVTAGPDYIPCLDNIQAIRKLKSTRHYEHRERHCPDEAPTCLVRLPIGYRTPIRWPKSRDMIWFANVPHTKLAEVKRQQNWVKVYGRYITFPGGGTQFKHGALHYIDFIQQTVPDIAWGKRSRVILDVGCGVASFGGYLFERDVVTMSLAPKDEHEAQVQFALERGMPAISAVMGTKLLPFPAMVFDIVHCARCRVPWHVEGGKLLLELDRVLRPGGYFVWSATPVYRRGAEDVSIWKAMSKLTKSMCWELVQVGKDKFNGVSAAMFRKPTSNSCYEGRQQNDPPLCEETDDPNAAWYTPLQACIHKVPTNPLERGTQWPAHWPSRLEKPPYWLKDSELGANNKLAFKKFIDDSNYWKHVVANSYLNGIGIDWSSVRNVMDMSASYGGFAAALKDLKVWVMNVVPVNASDTLPVIYERGLLGIYHDWCESFSTYPRSYDLLHADHLFSDLKKRCKFVSVMAEVDRILRPGSWLVVKDDSETIFEVESMARSLRWKIQFTQSKDNEGLLCVQKMMWRPSEEDTILSAIALA